MYICNICRKCIKQKTKLNSIHNKYLEGYCTLAPAVELKLTIQSYKMWQRPQEKELVSLTIEKQQPRLLYRPQNKQFRQGVMLKNMNERMKELAEIADLTMSSAYNL